MGFVGIKVNYTGQKKFLLIFLKFKLNKRGVSFLRECNAVCNDGFSHLRNKIFLARQKADLILDFAICEDLDSSGVLVLEKAQNPQRES